MKNWLWLLFTSAAIIVFLLVLSSTGKKPPVVPADTLHAPVTIQEACVVCHAPDRQAPLKPGHPPKEQCLVCHKVEKR